ncbi:SGNH hydrolase-type esterase domain-containing protein [Podospora didyma]|uniref:SGNH hydrolase-type esterase domain-containing protein n=1 Tax=Podospora didyma TaxID=330526 RepID=A0AAE0P808_9PEZI|nr:SGNH hydrolase-type esterase domain-containing protein [Podospora didyma]
MWSLISFVVVLRAALAGASAIPRSVNGSYYGLPDELQPRQGFSDPTAFTWVNRYAAIGDSYTAGIGAGEQLGFFFYNFGDWKCSRYDMSYPMLIRNYLGSNVESFQFPACSGHQTWQIYNQVNALQGNLDLVTLTAGGNDLCLVDIIKDCIVLAFYGEETCNTILAKAEDNVRTIMRQNIKDLLLALNGKMASNGVVVYNSYARFFSTASEKCATDQDFGLFPWVAYNWVGLRSTPLPLTVARRQRFNTLTTALNDLIRDVVHDVADEVNYKIGFANWDPWPDQGVDGQICSDSSSGAYPDSKQPELIFFKPDTRKTFWRWPTPFKKRDGELESNDTSTFSKREEDAVKEEPLIVPPLPVTDETGENVEIDRIKLAKQIEALRAAHPQPPREYDSNGVDRAVYKSSLWHSVNPRAAALKALDARAPSVPGCPSDPSPWLPGLGFLLPDMFGRIFHPNEKGHNAIASFTIAKAIDLRAEILGVTPQVCGVTDEFKCWQKEGRRAYATANKLDENYKTFCNELDAPSGGVTGWSRDRTFHQGTPDEHQFIVSLGSDASGDFNRQECLDSFERIIHGCDGDDPQNPMNWKFGGTWKKGAYTYEVSPKRDNRPWPPIKEPNGFCIGTYKGLFSDFQMAGSGFSSWDYGRDTILPNSKGCLGLGITKFNFQYFDEPDANGMEWKLTFRTPVFVSGRCYRSDKVVSASGGTTHGCDGDTLA